MIRMRCGDSFELIKQMPDASVDMVLTDPPYGMKFQSGMRKVRYDKIANDDNLDWLPSFVDELYRVMKDNTCCFCFCSWHKVDVFKQVFEKRFTLKNIIVWRKNYASMGDLHGSFAPMHEFIIFAVKGKRKLNGFRYPDVLDAKKTGNKYHPTEKPVDLLEILINRGSVEGEIVFDPFAGSGSTGVACVNKGRSFIGYELNEEYYRTAKQRLKEAVKAAK